MLLVDTNVLVHAADVRAAEHRRCNDLLNEWREAATPWFTTWGILYEFLRIATHPTVWNVPWDAKQAVEFVEAVLASSSLTVLTETPRHSAVARATVEEIPSLKGSVMHDAHTAILMREHGIRRIYTRDSDFRRFPFLEVIDPLA